ncbi:VWA domain-containing protein [Pseudomonas sp. R-28-1W-6]|uniref:VWA domain-containing protein n=1 Tax=Pseudomonas sp. R-28-1W-6 TaxID=2650101 RepID=UPI0013664030|nr:VWA domain-containing protein [Pseudomonas sp. R-28-1W-6]MWV12432.1 VWA domain-containing protein [Pseudomonas sp. R-28-1W-6]
MELVALWPHWLRPWSLLLVPPCAWLLWHLWHRERRSGRWQLLLPALFQAALLTGGRTRQNRLPWIALGLGWLLAILALLGPSWQRVEQASQKRADPLVVVLDLTPAMLAGDAAPNRLSQAKRKLLDLLRARQDAQTAILVYAGSAHTLVPLSDDLATASNLLDALKPSIMPEPGRRADLAMAKAVALLEQGAQGRGRLLLITSALSDEERQGIQQALGQRSEQLRILGIGTAQGAPILGEDGSFLKDAQGAILLPRLDSAGLRRFASELGGQYRQASLDDRDLRGLGLLDGPQALREDGEPTLLTAWADQGHWLLLPLLLLAACAGRRGWLFGLPLLLLALPQPSYAFELRDLWLRPDQQGQRLLQADKPREAAERFVDPQWRGEALYRAGDYPAAAERFALSDSASAHYNRGNALARSNELEAALDAYDQALEQQPDLRVAQQNKALVEQLLQQQKQQQQQQQADQQNQQNQQNQQSQDQGGESAPSSAAGQPQAEPGDQQEQNDGTDSSQAKAAGQDPTDEQQAAEQAAQPGQAEGEQPAPANEPHDATQAGAEQALGGEQRDALEQWLRQIPDEPGELLRRKFLYEQQQRQEQSR